MHKAFKAIAIGGLALLSQQRGAQGYKVKTAKSGDTVRWSPGPLLIEVAVDDLDNMSAEQAGEYVENAFRAWQERLPQPMVVKFRKSLRSSPVEPNPLDGRNIVRFVHSNWPAKYGADALAVTLTSHDPTTGRIVDADIMINAEKYTWGDGTERGCHGSYDLQNVVTHEVGHLFGLEHEANDRDATMFASSAKCETKKRDLADDDVAGAQHLYTDLEPITPVDEGEGVGAPGCEIGQSAATTSKNGSKFGLSLLGLMGIALFWSRRKTGAKK